jgi:HlyD family secretion protein
MERPSIAEDRSKTSMFKLDPSGRFASRTEVRFGHSSVSTIEVVGGLQVGDQVILSDMSQWDKADRVRLN